MIRKHFILTAVAVLFTQTSALATTLTCSKSNGPWRATRAHVATLTYDLSTSERGSLEVLGETYKDNVELKFSRQGPLTQGLIPGVFHFRVQSLMPTTNDLYYARLSFPDDSTSAQHGKTYSLLCRVTLSPKL